jgi:hypothetical protein
MQPERVALGFAVAPLPALALFALITMPPPAAIGAGLVVGYCGTALVGVPIYLFLHAIRREGLVHYVAVTALVLSLFPLFAFVLEILPQSDPTKRNPHTLWSLLNEPALQRLAITGVICACITAAVFWFIAVRRTVPPQA